MTSSSLTLTVGLPQIGPGGVTPSELPRIAQALEESGVDRIAINEHVVMGENLSGFPWGDVRIPPETPWLEPLLTLAALGAVTRRVRLMTSVLIVPLRPAPLLAKTAATLDVLSGGRLDLGVGTGWHLPEFLAGGVDYDRRGQLLTEAIETCRAFWEEGPAFVQTGSGDIEKIWCEPKPTQSRIPIWFSGGIHQRNLDRIVRLGDGWLPGPRAALDEVSAGALRLRKAWTLGGRLGTPLVRWVAGRRDLCPEQLAETVRSCAAAGVTDLFVPFASMYPGYTDLDRIEEIFRHLRCSV